MNEYTITDSGIHVDTDDTPKFGLICGLVGREVLRDGTWWLIHALDVSLNTIGPARWSIRLWWKNGGLMRKTTVDRKPVYGTKTMQQVYDALGIERGRASGGYIVSDGRVLISGSAMLTPSEGCPCGKKHLKGPKDNIYVYG